MGIDVPLARREITVPLMTGSNGEHPRRGRSTEASGMLAHIAGMRTLYHQSRQPAALFGPIGASIGL